MKITQNFNLKKLSNSRLVRMFTNQSIRELDEYEFSSDIKSILAMHPDHIRQETFNNQIQYFVYSNRGSNDNQINLVGTFYTITPNAIARSGYFHRSKVSDEFIKKMYQEVAAHYNARFQPKSER